MRLPFIDSDLLYRGALYIYMLSLICFARMDFSEKYHTNICITFYGLRNYFKLWFEVRKCNWWYSWICWPSRLKLSFYQLFSFMKYDFLFCPYNRGDYCRCKISLEKRFCVNFPCFISLCTLWYTFF
jgi:hypothetical protein